VSQPADSENEPAGDPSPADATAFERAVIAWRCGCEAAVLDIERARAGSPVPLVDAAAQQLILRDLAWLLRTVELACRTLRRLRRRPGQARRRRP
jgi:hypothetical protein